MIKVQYLVQFAKCLHKVLYICMTLDLANRRERTLVFEWCVVMCGCKDRNQNYVYLKEETIFKEDYVLKFMLIILGSIGFNLIWGTYKII